MKGILCYLEESARKFPDKTAVSDRDKSYTFSQLREGAARLAAAVDPSYTGKPVLVFCDRSADTVLMILAVLMSGNFYLPVDPDLPEEKLKKIILDAAPEYAFGAPAYRDRFTGVYLTPADMGDAVRETPRSAEDTPLYLVYTSGSTGTPKGVLKSHGGMIDFAETFCGVFDITEKDVLGNQTPFFFDASAKDLYIMLKTGAALEVIPTEKFAMPPELIDYMNERRVSVILWVPTAYTVVAKLRTFSFVKPETLRRAFFVGEVMPVKTLAYWRKNLPDVRFVNLYGQSEIAGVCCCHEITGDLPDILPLGKALPNCRVCLMRDGTPVTEAGQTGELYIASPALALEYYHDAEKTAASFVTADFGQGAVRAFRTGDLAAYNEKGELVFVSRADFQIKYGGHRIELGEIEAAANALPGVARCGCIYDKEKEKIVLFAEAEEGVTGGDIRRMLKEKLSAYMIPHRVEVLDKLPQNANGKIDRAALAGKGK